MLIIAAPFKAIASTLGSFWYAFQCCSKHLSKSDLELDRSFPNCEIDGGGLMFKREKCIQISSTHLARDIQLRAEITAFL